MQSTLKTVLFKTGIFGFRSTFSRKLAPLQNRILFRFSSTTYDFDNTNKSPNVEETNEDFSDLQEYLDDPSKQFLLLNQPDNPNATVFRKQEVDENGVSYGTGKRKTAVARVWIRPGCGHVLVNGKEVIDYFNSSYVRAHALEPFMKTNLAGLYNVTCVVKGGGNMGQAGAIRLGIARALEANWPLLKPLLRDEGLLTRDTRRVERKKPGRKKARKQYQWVKR